MISCGLTRAASMRITANVLSSTNGAITAAGLRSPAPAVPTAAKTSKNARRFMIHLSMRGTVRVERSVAFHDAQFVGQHAAFGDQFARRRGTVQARDRAIHRVLERLARDRVERQRH